MTSKISLSSDDDNQIYLHLRFGDPFCFEVEKYKQKAKEDKVLTWNEKHLKIFLAGVSLSICIFQHCKLSAPKPLYDGTRGKQKKANTF